MSETGLRRVTVDLALTVPVELWVDRDDGGLTVGHDFGVCVVTSALSDDDIDRALDALPGGAHAALERAWQEAEP